MNSRVLYWQKLWSEFAVWGKVRIECSTSCLPCWWLCCYIDPVKCLWNVSPPPSSLSPPSHPPPNSSSGLCVFLLFIPNIIPIFPPSFFSCVSSRLVLHLLHPCRLDVEYMMDEMERRSIMEEPVRKCPIPAPRTSVPSPSASPSLRHKSE